MTYDGQSALNVVAIIEFNPPKNRLEDWHGGLLDMVVLDASGLIRQSIKSAHLALGVVSEKSFNADTALSIEQTTSVCWSTATVSLMAVTLTVRCSVQIVLSRCWMARLIMRYCLTALLSEY